MAKKSFICVFAIIVLSLCCGMCFAAEEGSSVNLGNEIMQSLNKTGDSAKNVVSGNIVGDTANTVKKGVDNVGNAVRDVGNDVQNGVEDVDGNGNNNGDNRRTGDYNVTRTVTEATTDAGNGFGTMTTTTWMWIILVVAAIIIIAAIWYYATQNNS